MTSKQTATLAPEAASFSIVLPTLYGAQVLAALWALGGGESGVFWSRQYLLAVFLAAISAIGLKVLAQPWPYPFRASDARDAWRTALLTALPVLIALFAVKHYGHGAWLAAVTPPHIGAALFFSFVLSPLAEIPLRGLLVPAWGIAGVAFLDALTVGFGIQIFAVFVAYWAMGFVWGKLAQRAGLRTALLTRILWSLFVSLALLYI